MSAQSPSFASNRSSRRPVPRSTGAMSVSTAATSISPWLKLIALTIFLPEEFSFYVFDFRLTLVRLILFLLTPFLFANLIQSVASGKSKLAASDIFIVLTGVWMIVSSTTLVDFGYALHHTGPAVGEIWGSYLATRVLLSQPGQALSFVKLICSVIVIVALFGVPDTLAGKPLTRDFLSHLTGYAPRFSEVTEVRWGLHRAEGLLEHYIFYGSVCAIGLLLAVALPIRAKRLTIVTCALGTFLSLSGGPFQAAILELVLHTYDRLFAKVRYRWQLLIVIVALAYGALSLVTADPLAFVQNHLLLDSGSYWTRVYQWNTIGPIALTSPWVGVGTDVLALAHEMSLFVTPSINSLWLYQATTYGIPCAILLGLSMISVICYRTRGPGVNLTIDESKLAAILGIVIAVFFLLGFSVDFWGSLWMFLGLLMGAKARLVDLGHRTSPAVTEANASGRVRAENHRVSIQAT